MTLMSVLPRSGLFTTMEIKILESGGLSSLTGGPGDVIGRSLTAAAILIGHPFLFRSGPVYFSLQVPCWALFLLICFSGHR